MKHKLSHRFVSVLLLAVGALLCNTAVGQSVTEQGSQGHWHWSGNIASTDFKNNIRISVVFVPNTGCNDALFVLVGNDEVNSMRFTIDNHRYNSLEVEPDYFDNGVPFVSFPLSDAAVRQLKRGQKVTIDTNVGNLTASLSGSAVAFNNTYENCRRMTEAPQQQVNARTDSASTSTHTSSNASWTSHRKTAKIELTEQQALVGVYFDEDAQCESPVFYVLGMPGLRAVDLVIDQQPMGQLALEEHTLENGLLMSASRISNVGVQALSHGNQLVIGSSQGNLNVPLSGSTNAFRQAHAFCQNILARNNPPEQRRSSQSANSPAAALQGFVEGLRQMGDGKALKEEINRGDGYEGLEKIFRIGQQMEQNAQNAQRQLERSLGISEAEAQSMRRERVCRDACSSQRAACYEACGVGTNFSCRNACSRAQESCNRRCGL